MLSREIIDLKNRKEAIIWFKKQGKIGKGGHLYFPYSHLRYSMKNLAPQDK